jgi:hypothetical protein
LSKLIEVKAKVAMLQNTAVGNNYTDGNDMMSAKLIELKDVITKRKPSVNPSADDLNKQVNEVEEDFKPEELNINIKFLKTNWLTHKKRAIKNGLTDNEFARWFVSLFYTIKFTKEVEVEQPGIWTNSSHYGDNLVNELITETELYFKNETTTEAVAQSFLNKLGWHSLRYYQKCDEFKKLLYADIENNDNSIIIYDPLKATESEFSELFKIANGPSWTDKTTNNCFKLKSS